MILWYSGCGNSRFVADTLSRELSDSNMVFIPEAARQGTVLEFGPDDVLGIVFPVYAWSVPKLVSEFLRTAPIKGKPAYIFAACTCGDETGLTEKHLKKDLAKQDLTLDAFFAFQMPETYVNLPGFKLDTPDNEQRKINATKNSLTETLKLIQQRAKGSFNKFKGGASFLKSNNLKSLFYALLITDRKFIVSDACIGCGICAKNCPLQNITIENDRPHWNGHCTNCMSCYHRCPKNAINFGKATLGKGQYYFTVNN